MKHSSSLAIWLGLGAAFLGILTTLFSVWAAQRKKAVQQAASRLDAPNQPSV